MLKWEDIVNDPNFPEDEEEQNILKQRFWEKISKDPKFPTDNKEYEELKNRFFGIKPSALPSLQDIAKIMPKAVPEFKWERQVPEMGAKYIPAKVVSGLIERPLAAMGEPISWALEKGFRALGLSKIADTQKGVTELYKAPPITQKVQQQTAISRQKAYSQGQTWGVAFDITEGVTQLMNLLTQVGVAKKLPGLQGQDIYSHFKVMAGHAIATTPGGLPERLQAAMFRMAYSMTPFIANWTGATGLTAVATDTALNIFLTSPVYQKAWKESENAQEFFQLAIPQLVMDIGMAWNTRGLPANQAKAMYTRYLKMEDRMIKMEVKEFQELAENLKVQVEGKEKLKPKILPEIGLKYKGKAFRAETGILERGEVIQKKFESAQDKLDYDAKTFGNIAIKEKVEGIAEKMNIDLSKVSSKDLTWVASKLETAQKYGKAKEVKLPKDTIVLAKDEEGGSLILKDSKKYIKEPRIGEKEALLESEEGAISLEFIPSKALIEDVAVKLQSKWDVQAPFVKIGANETGFQLKNYHSQITWGQEKGIVAIKGIVKIGQKNKLVPDDFTEVTFASESLQYRLKMNPELRKKIEPIIKKVETFYKEWEGRLKDIGWMEDPFPQSLINRNNRSIESYRKILKQEYMDLPSKKLGVVEYKISKDERTKIENAIKELQAQNKKIESLDLRFVSVPIRMIIGNADSAVGKHFMSILPKWGRKTLTVKDLVDEGVLTREQADIRAIIGEYSDRMSRKYALGKIFKAAEADGLIAKAYEKPEWVEFTAKIIPQLKGKKLNPAFNDMLVSYFGAVGRGMGLRGTWQNFIGITKMMQFYNPLFLPMYDVFQGAAAGTFTSKGTPKNIVKAWKDSTTKSIDYWEAFENGLFSKPFTIPYDRFETKLNDVIKPDTLKKLGLKAANVYQLSWNLAWKGDEIVRLMTYNHLKDKGMSAREAAQTAAMFHSDYASVPPATRKFLNQIFFTPTFKIAMTKLYGSMLKGVVRTALHPRTAGVQDKTYAKGMVMAYAMLEGIEFFFNNLGYETDEKYRKYVRRVQTDEGIKESVITVANPFNIPWRYYYRGKSALEVSELNKLEQIARQVKYELTPVYRVAIGVVQNEYNNVYNPLDNADKQIGSTVKYIVGELVKITKPIFETTKEEEFKTNAFDVLQKDLGTLTAVLLQPFIFHYVRDIKDVRLQKDIYWFIRDSKNILKYTKDPEKKRERLINYYEMLQKLWDKLGE